MSEASPQLGGRVLDWLLRRLHQGTRLEADLVLVRDSDVLGELPRSFDTGGQRWRVARVTGELTLRAELPEADRLVAVVPVGFIPPPDLAGRAYLGRPVSVRPQDVVAGLAGRFCEPLGDGRVAQAVVEALPQLATHAGMWSVAGTVTKAEVRRVLVAVQLGTDRRLDRESKEALLTRWIVEGPPEVHAPALLTEALADVHGRAGRWLAWAVTDGSVEKLVAAGALAGSDAAWAEAPAVPGIERSGDRLQLRQLVEAAVREAHRRDAERALAVLTEAEAAAHRVRDLEQDRPPLLRAALERALHRALTAAAAGDPLDDAELEGLGANLHARRAADALDLARATARLARFAAGAEEPEDLDGWCAFARDHGAWADRALREARRAVGAVGADLAEPGRRVIARALTRRDELNAAFAQALSAGWSELAGRHDLRRPLALHHVGRSLVRRLVDDGQRVFLVVLDGCDLSTFLELVDTLGDDASLGLVQPGASNATLRDDLEEAGPLHVAVAPVPTVTSHSRRALLAGEVPGNTALTETEAEAVVASADRAAFDKHKPLQSVTRRLLLKGDLGPDGEEVLAALAGDDLQLLAVVFNAVDDKLSDKGTAPFEPWRLDQLGGGVGAALRAAVARRWTVVVTADHGHTPHVDSERKASAGALGQRYGKEPVAGAVAFESGPLPSTPLYLLTAMGAWHGQQRRGYHGGASLEEVVVPLAFLGQTAPGAGRPRPPAWWWGRAEDVELPELPPPDLAPPAASVGGGGVPERVREVLAGQTVQLAALEALVERGVLTLAQMSAIVGKPAFLTGGMLGGVLRLLAQAGEPAPFVVEGEGNERVFRWKGGA